VKTLRIKKYFLDVNDREQLEKQVLDKHPEYNESILEWDDEELLERINIDKEKKRLI